MASPIGHALAGIAVAWGADLFPGNRQWRAAPPSAPWHRRAGNGLTLACAALAAAPDMDLLVTGFHRSMTHSLTSVVVVALVAGVAAARARRPVIRVAGMCALAWGSHILLDWLSTDRSTPNGLQILWPFGDRWFISGWDLFPGTERRRMFSAASIKHNTAALVWELALLMPIVMGLWLIRVKALAGLPSQPARGDHPAE